MKYLHVTYEILHGCHHYKHNDNARLWGFAQQILLYRICTSVTLNWMRQTEIYAAGKKVLIILVGTAY